MRCSVRSALHASVVALYLCVPGQLDRIGQSATDGQAIGKIYFLQPPIGATNLQQQLSRVGVAVGLARPIGHSEIQQKLFEIEEAKPACFGPLENHVGKRPSENDEQNEVQKIRQPDWCPIWLRQGNQSSWP